ncbi:hypothetical protein ACOME3_009175 [Neoechinorhynchus agilis]
MMSKWHPHGGGFAQLRLSTKEELRLEVCQIRPTIIQSISILKSEVHNILGGLKSDIAALSKQVTDHTASVSRGLLVPNSILSTNRSSQDIEDKFNELKLTTADILVANIPRLMVSELDVHEDFQLQEDTIILIVRRGMALGCSDDEIVKMAYDEICTYCGENRIWICTLGRRNDCTWSFGNYCEDMGFNIADKHFDLTSFMVPCNAKDFVKTGTVKLSTMNIQVRYKGYSNTDQLKVIVETIKSVLDMPDRALENKARLVRDRIEHLNGQKTACFLGADFKQYGVDSTARFLQTQINAIQIVIFEANN